MKYKARFIALAALISFGGFLSITDAQTSVASRPQNSLLAALPASDAVAIVKVRRVFDEALPKFFSGNTAKLAEINARIEQFKTRTGLDPRSFDELALGLHYTHPAAGVTKVQTVGIARGSFSPEAIVAAGKAAAAGTYRQEKNQGKTIHVFTINEQLKIFGLADLRIRELAVAQLDANTLALGDIERVRTTVSQRRGTQRANAELIAMIADNPNSIVSFAGNITPAVIASLKIGNDAIATNLAAVRQIYGSFGVDDKNLDMLIAARTVNADSARDLNDTVESLRQIGAMVASQMSSTRGALARSALGNLKITRQGNEIQMRTAVAQSDLAPLIGAR